MKIIGITGGIGAGKSTVSNEFKRHGAFIIDADEISRQITRKGEDAYKEIIDYFGSSIIGNDGEINRKILAGIVFSDNEKLQVLNNITHKYIFKKIEEKISLSESDIVILDVPLLFASDFSIKCDLKIAVIADKETRINRVIKRDNTDRDSVIKRMNAQLTDEEFRRLADVCIENNNLSDMQKQVGEIVDLMRR